ncbi:hypothetical protein MP228_010560 [Amoeboaphelidium protococcarum]|nr:hypothetical protein MP228_010560 [Amoeboaphelidium protococcarum]
MDASRKVSMDSNSSSSKKASRISADAFEASALTKLIQDLHQGQQSGELKRTTSVRMNRNTSAGSSVSASGQSNANSSNPTQNGQQAAGAPVNAAPQGLARSESIRVVKMTPSNSAGSLKPDLNAIAAYLAAGDALNSVGDLTKQQLQLNQHPSHSSNLSKSGGSYTKSDLQSVDESKQVDESTMLAEISKIVTSQKVIEERIVEPSAKSPVAVEVVTQDEMSKIEPQQTNMTFDELNAIHTKLADEIEVKKAELKALEATEKKVDDFSTSVRNKKRVSIASFLSIGGKKQTAGDYDANAHSGATGTQAQAVKQKQQEQKQDGDQAGGLKRSKSLFARTFGNGNKAASSANAQQASSNAVTEPSQTGGGGVKIMRGLSLRKSRPTSLLGPNGQSAAHQRNKSISDINENLPSPMEEDDEQSVNGANKSSGGILKKILGVGGSSSNKKDDGHRFKIDHSTHDSFAPIYNPPAKVDNEKAQDQTESKAAPQSVIAQVDESVPFLNLPGPPLSAPSSNNIAKDNDTHHPQGEQSENPAEDLSVVSSSKLVRKLSNSSKSSRRKLSGSANLVLDSQVIPESLEEVNAIEVQKNNESVRASGNDLEQQVEIVAASVNISNSGLNNEEQQTTQSTQKDQEVQVNVVIDQVQQSLEAVAKSNLVREESKDDASELLDTYASLKSNRHSTALQLQHQVDDSKIGQIAEERNQQAPVESDASPPPAIEEKVDVDNGRLLMKDLSLIGHQLESAIAMDSSETSNLKSQLDAEFSAVIVKEQSVVLGNGKNQDQQFKNQAILEKGLSEISADLRLAASDLPDQKFTEEQAESVKPDYVKTLQSHDSDSAGVLQQLSDIVKRSQELAVSKFGGHDDVDLVTSDASKTLELNQVTQVGHVDDDDDDSLEDAEPVLNPEEADFLAKIGFKELTEVLTKSSSSTALKSSNSQVMMDNSQLTRKVSSPVDPILESVAPLPAVISSAADVQKVDSPPQQAANAIQTPPLIKKPKPSLAQIRPSLSGLQPSFKSDSKTNLIPENGNVWNLASQPQKDAIPAPVQAPLPKPDMNDFIKNIQGIGRSNSVLQRFRPEAVQSASAEQGDNTSMQDQGLNDRRKSKGINDVARAKIVSKFSAMFEQKMSPQQEQPTESESYALGRSKTMSMRAQKTAVVPRQEAVNAQIPNSDSQQQQTGQTDASQQPKIVLKPKPSLSLLRKNVQ